MPLFYLFILVTQLSKSVEKNLAFSALFNFWNKHFMILEHNSCHKQTKLLTRGPYSVFGQWK